MSDVEIKSGLPVAVPSHTLSTVKSKPRFRIVQRRDAFYVQVRFLFFWFWMVDNRRTIFPFRIDDFSDSNCSYKSYNIESAREAIDLYKVYHTPPPKITTKIVEEI